MNLQEINASASPEVQINENFETLDFASVYGKDPRTTENLTWVYYGGRWATFTITGGLANAITLTDDAVNYLVVARATGVLSASTSATNWNDSTNYARVYKVTTASGVVSAIEDHRGGTPGVFALIGGQGDVLGPASATDGDIARFDGATGKLLKAGIALSTDGTLAANSDSVVATQKAVKTYADALIAANDAMVYKGATDCSANPNYPAADAGHTYRVSVAGKIGGASGKVVEVGDFFMCNTDGTASGDEAAVGTKWNVIQTNLDGAVIGPASATDGLPPLWDGATGKLLKNATAAQVRASIGLDTGDSPTFAALILTAGLALTGAASNIALGSNYISNGGTDAGLSFDGSNNATLSANLTVSGTGPHAIGGATVSTANLTLTGGFAGNQIGVYNTQTISPPVAGDAYGVLIAPTINKQSSGTHADFAGMRLSVPTIGAGAATLTNATTLKIDGAPSVGTNQQAFWVTAGRSILGAIPSVAAGGLTVNYTTSYKGMTLAGTAAQGVMLKYQLEASSGKYNWFVGNNFYGTNIFEITPSSAVDGDTIGSTPAFAVSNTGLGFVSASFGVGYSTPDNFNQLTSSPQLVVGAGSGTRGITIYSGNANSGVLAFADGLTGNQQYRGYLSYDHATDILHINGATNVTVDSGFVAIGTITTQTGSDGLIVGNGYSGNDYRSDVLFHGTNSSGTHKAWYIGPNVSGAANNNFELYTETLGLVMSAVQSTGAVTFSGAVRGLTGTFATATPVGGYILEATANANSAMLAKTVGAGAASAVYTAWHDATSGDNTFINFVTETSVTFRGNITYNRGGGVVAYNTTSDYRLKEVRGLYTNAAAELRSLVVHDGKMRDATMWRPMFLAHEAQAIVPYAVTGTKDGTHEDGSPAYQQMDHQIIVPLLTAGWQAHDETLEDLKAWRAKAEAALAAQGITIH